MNELHGKLADQPLPTLLHQIFVARATGTLRLLARAGKHEVFFREGYPVGVSLPGSAELLGKVLLEMGLIDEATYKRTMAAPPQKGQRYGEALLGSGLVTNDQIRLALKAQVRRKLHRLFFLGDADFSFEAGEHQQGLHNNESLKVHPYRAVYHGVRSAWPPDRLVGALFLLEGRAIKCTLSPEEVARYGVGQDDGRVAELLRKGYWTMADLVDGAGLPPQPVHALVYALYITDALDIRGADEVPRLKRKAGEAPAIAPSGQAPRHDSGTWKVPSGVFTMPQPLTPKSIPIPRPLTPSGGTPTAAATAPAAAPDIETVRKQIELKAKVVETETLFEVLGLAPTATRDEVKTAYFDAAKRFHPDRLVSMGLEALRPDVEKIFRRVSEAYGTLYDDAQREAYRQSLTTPASKDSGEAHAKAMKMLEAEMAFRRGEILLRKNDFTGAIAELELAVAANPSEGEHLAYLTWARLCAGQLAHAAAKPMFQEATRLSPRCARAFYYLGLCLKEEKDTDRAYAAFKKAYEIDPRMLDAEREIRLINMRREKEKSSKGGFLNKLLKK